MQKKTPEDLKFYYADQNPCPYLSDQIEQQIFTVLKPDMLHYWSGQLNRRGFRRSLNTVYMPNCARCNACQSVRVLVESFQMTKNMKRVFHRGRAFHITHENLAFNHEKYALFKRYLNSRHHESDMNTINDDHFRQLIEVAPANAFLLCVYDDQNRIVAVMIVDHYDDGFSAVYSFFDPDLKQYSLGVLMILHLLDRAKDKKMPYVYLGYYVKNAPNMAYKARFKPLEFFDWDHSLWLDFNPS